MGNTRILKGIKLVVLDLDRTLLNDSGIVSEKTRQLIKELEEYGVQFTFATGRLHSAITNIAEELAINTPLISLDGSLIKSHPEGEILFEFFVKERYVRKAVNYAEELNLNIALCHADAIFFTKENSVIPQLMEKFGAKYKLIDSYDSYYKETLEVVFAGENRNFMNFVWGRMSFPYSFGLNTSYFKSQRHENIYYLEIRRKKTSKGKGMLRLLKYMKIKPEEAVVIGDWYNDISLFKTNSFKVALSNSIPEIKKLANLTIDKNNDEEGVAEFLEKLLEIKKVN